jgi:glutaredoxin 3
MARITVYTTPYCPYCARAKLLLRSKGVDFDEIDASDDNARSRLVRRTQWPTVPQIFIGEEFIGGYDELQALEDEGRLDAMLAGPPMNPYSRR